MRWETSLLSQDIKSLNEIKKSFAKEISYTIYHQQKSIFLSEWVFKMYVSYMKLKIRFQLQPTGLPFIYFLGLASALLGEVVHI